MSAELDESTRGSKRSKVEEDFTPTSVLFTGGAGFIGSNVMLHLMSLYPGVQFVCLDKLDYWSVWLLPPFVLREYRYLQIAPPRTTSKRWQATRTFDL